jgi:hypothetical protein
MDTVTIVIANKLSADEREVHLYYDSDTELWTMDSTVPKYFRKALRQGWTPVKQYVYDDGTICGMVLTAPEKSVTIRNTVKKQMSDKQMRNLFSDDDEL